MSLDDIETWPEMNKLEGIINTDLKTAANNPSDAVDFSKTDKMISNFTNPELQNIVDTIATDDPNKNNEEYDDPAVWPRLSELLKQ